MPLGMSPDAIRRINFVPALTSCAVSAWQRIPSAAVAVFLKPLRLNSKTSALNLSWATRNMALASSPQQTACLRSARHRSRPRLRDNGGHRPYAIRDFRRFACACRRGLTSSAVEMSQDDWKRHYGPAWQIVQAGLKRAKSEGKKLGRPPIAAELEDAIRRALNKPGRTEGVRKIAERFGVNPGTVQRISRPFDASAAVA
jgi:hypothetical protein